jgi:hypothetical protein
MRHRLHDQVDDVVVLVGLLDQVRMGFPVPQLEFWEK